MGSEGLAHGNGPDPRDHEPPFPARALVRWTFVNLWGLDVRGQTIGLEIGKVRVVWNVGSISHRTEHPLERGGDFAFVVISVHKPAEAKLPVVVETGNGMS